jgi:SnoaL-like domain
MNEASVWAALQRYWEYAAIDSERAHEIYHDDAILEFPQSQEHFEGKANFMAWRKIYPASVDFKIQRIRGLGNIWVTEALVRYDGGPWNYGVSIHEFRGDKIARETIYFGEGWQAPEWRAPWRAVWKDEGAVGL